LNIEKNIEKIRAGFPHLKHMIHLGAAGSAPLEVHWFNAMREYWDIVYNWSGLSGGGSHSFLSTMGERTKIDAAKFINADVEEITWVTRMVEGINICKDLIPWKKGDNIVFTDQGYPSSGHSFLPLRKKGVELRQVQNVNGKVLLHGGPSIKKEIVPDCWAYGDLDQAIDERTKLVCINRTTWHLGFTYDVEAVCKLAHEKGAYVVDDAFQAAGAIKIDVRKDNIDFFLTGSYKWQCGPLEAGIFYIRKDLCEEIEPPYQQYIYANVPEAEGEIYPPGAYHILNNTPAHDNITSYYHPLVKNADRFQYGVIANSMLWGWQATLEYLNKLGPSNIQKRDRKLGEYLLGRVSDLGCKVNTPLDDKTSLENLHLLNYSTGSFEKDKKCCAALRNQKPIPIRGPTPRWQGGAGGIRICTHFYNTEEDIDAFIKVQKSLM
jgi:selenocysteine lyase/cysteine desulfurase